MANVTNEEAPQENLFGTADCKSLATRKLNSGKRDGTKPGLWTLDWTMDSIMD